MGLATNLAILLCLLTAINLLGVVHGFVADDQGEQKAEADDLQRDAQEAGVQQEDHIPTGEGVGGDDQASDWTEEVFVDLPAASEHEPTDYTDQDQDNAEWQQYQGEETYQEDFTKQAQTDQQDGDFVGQAESRGDFDDQPQDEETLQPGEVYYPPDDPYFTQEAEAAGTGEQGDTSQFAASDSKDSRDMTPNILILYADDLGIGDLGCYGNTSLKTPNIDSMAAQGARLTHHLAASATGVPSRAGLLTGRLPIRYGMAPTTTTDEMTYLSSLSGLPPTETTFAKVLQQNGYKTGLIGKWGLGINCERSGDLCHHPNNHGFDYFFGAPIGNLASLGPHGGRAYFDLYPEVGGIIFLTPIAVILAAFFLRKYVGARVVQVLSVSAVGYAAWAYFFFTQPQLWSSALMRNGEFVEQPINFERMTERLVKEGTRFLKLRQEDGRPFLLVMSWLQVHSHLHGSERFKGVSDHGRYGDEVEELDWGVGEMLTVLKTLRLDRNTVVYFTSDNGANIEEMDHLSRRIGGNNGPFRGGKYQGGQDGGIRTPGLVLWPGVVPAGLDIDDPTSQLDLAPTLTEAAAGVSLPSDRLYDGKSILRLWKGHTKASPHKILFHYCGGFLHTARYLPDSGTDVYTVYFYWPNWLSAGDQCGPPGCSCIHDYHQLATPAVYNIVADPGLTSPLDTSDFVYEDILSQVSSAIVEHEKSLGQPENEFTWPKRSWHVTLQPCCNFPTCSCEDPENALQDADLV